MRQILILIILLATFKMYSQPWLHEYPSSWDYHYYGQIRNDYDNGYLFTVLVTNASNNQHHIMYKLNDNASVEYDKLFGIPYLESTYYDPTLLSNGGVIMSGSLWFSPDPENPSLLKLDECKEKVWCTTLTNNPYHSDFFCDVAETSDGNIVAMSLQNDIDLERYRVHLHKFSSTGEQIWRKPVLSKDDHPLIDDPAPWDLDILPDGRFLISGLCYWPNPGPTQVTYIRMFTALFNAEGNEDWFYVHGINDYVYSLGNMSVLHNGCIYTSGAFYPSPSPLQTVPVLFKNDLDGNLIGAYTINIPPIGDLHAAGTFNQSEFLEGRLFCNAYMYRDNIYDRELATFEIDTAGNLQDFFMPADSFRLTHNGFPVITKDNAIITSGNSEGASSTNYDVYAMRLLTDSLRLDSIPYSNFTYDSLCDHPIVSSIIALDSCRIIVSNDHYSLPVNSRELIMVPTPVPTRDLLTIEYKNPLYFRHISIKCFNETGLLINEWTVNSGIDSQNINVSSWPAGLYIAVAFSNNVKVGSCKIIISR